MQNYQSYYAYTPTQDGKEPIGTEGRHLLALKTDEGAMRRCDRLFRDKPYRLYQYSNIYDDKTFRFIHASSGQNYALNIRKYLREWAGSAEPWTREEAASLKNIALSLYTRHDCGGSRRIDMRENCGACVLSGYAPYGEKKALRQTGPNYAGWLRLYVQMNRLPSKWRRATKREIETNDNQTYLAALKRDVVTFLAD